MKPELLEKRDALIARMKELDAKDDNEAFSAAEKELRDLDARIERQKKLDAAERLAPGTPVGGDAKLVSEIRSKFSLLRATAGAAGLAVDWGFEREVQPELAKRAGKAAKGVYVPLEIFEQRVQVKSSDPAGGYLVATDYRPDQFVSALTAASVVRGLGARVLSGLQGDVAIPRETGAPAIGWVGENAALSPSDAAFGMITMLPRHAGALNEWSRNMLLQSSPDIETLSRQMLARDLALAIDRAAINGGGTLEPVGVLQTAGIQTHAYATDLFTSGAVAIGKADTENVGANRSFLTTPSIREICLKELDANKLPVPVAAIFHDQPVVFPNQAPKTLGSGSDHAFVYGDWSELLIGIWSEIDILVNPFESTAYSKGNVSVRALATVDAAVRHTKAFVSVTGVTTSAVAIA